MLDSDANFDLELETFTSKHTTQSSQVELEHDRLSDEPPFSLRKRDDFDRLDYIKKQLINSNLSRNKEDLENLTVHFKHRLKHKPFDLNLTLSLGNCLEKLGQVNRLKRLYSRFNGKKQHTNIIAFRLAEIFFSEGSYKKAQIYYQQALGINASSNKEEIYIKLAYCYQNMKEFELGSKYVILALKGEISSLSPEIQFLFGNLFLGAKQFKKARKLYEQALESLNAYLIQIKNLVHLSVSEKKIPALAFHEALNRTCPKMLEPKILTNLGSALNKLGKYALAKNALEKAISLADLPQTYNNLALTYKALGNLEAALASLYKANELLPNSILINQNLAETNLAMGNESKALEYFHKTLALDKRNQSASFKLNALLGKKIACAPENYVSNLFDKYSETYDQHLLSSLDYTVPEKISHLINEKYGKTGTIGRVLDLGCGTGLCGVEIKDRCSELIGIDLSKQMLIKAKQKSAYTHLENIEITEYLRKSKSMFDIMIAADVLIYVGKLDKLFHYCSRKIRSGGCFIFSIETTETKNFQVNKTGRFSHNKKYIEDLAKKTLWHINSKEETEIRKENGFPVRGFLFSLIKN